VSDLILHHYPESLFSEKVRLILGHKKLTYRSVTIPIIMPKPDLMALTGGYRRTPVLQIGANVYCDTALIAEVLERVAPTPSLYDPARKALIQTLAQWGDSNLFWAGIGYFTLTDGVAQALGHLPPEAIKAYHDDRAALLKTQPLRSLAETAATLMLYAKRLEQMLAGGDAFLLGGSPTLADMSCYHPLWILQMVPSVGAILAHVPGVQAWMQRVQAVGHGNAVALSATEALDVARNAAATPIDSGESDIPGIALGEMVEVMPSDYGIDPVRGELVLVAENCVAVRRHDPRAGTVVVHFPRIGYLIRQAD
jgi:glutathione S-transferase